MDKTVLIEEDVQGIQKILNSTLGHKGYKVVESARWEGTVELARKLKPNLIFLDTQLPLGQETVRILKADKETKHIPVWAFTSNYLPADKEKYLDSGCEFYLMKPVGIANLLHILRLIDERFQSYC